MRLTIPCRSVVVCFALLAMAAAPAHGGCVGDCDTTGEVTINELLTMVNIALGTTTVSSCEAGDANDDGQVSVDEIVRAVQNALNGCPGPTATPTATPSVSSPTAPLPPSTATPTATPSGLVPTVPPASTATPTPDAPSPTATAVWTLSPFDLTDIAPPLPQTELTDLATATRFLYEAPDPIQVGVAPGTIDPLRAAVLRGVVYDRAMDPLSGVTISILDHPEYGQTLTRANGMFDLAVNGGERLTVSYQKDGYLLSQRQITPRWQSYAFLPDVVLITPDARVTTVDLSRSDVPFQVVRGSVQEDADGARQATLLFPQGTQAEVVMPDGTREPITTLSVRATEFTVGPNGPLAMPADLPPNVAYTYAVVFTADEAKAAGAEDVVFEHPIPFYVENFLDFPIGIPVPLGVYEAERGEWIASESGVVIKILSIIDGAADLDTDGDGDADDGVALGITPAERQQLASLYTAGQSLWRMLIPHFDSPWDANWGMFCVTRDVCERPKEKPPTTEEFLEDGSCQAGSIIGCQDQTLGENLPIAGTPFSLNYRSDRGPGRVASYQLKIPLSGPSLPDGVVGIRVVVEVAGRRVERRFPPLTNLITTFTWDGKDAYGRALAGAQSVWGSTGYVYKLAYTSPSRFGADPQDGNPITADRERAEITLWQNWYGLVGTWDARAHGLGGWTLDVVHAYDPATRTVFLGDGGRTGGVRYGVLGTVAGSGARGGSGDGGPAIEARLDHPHGVALGPDGSVYIADEYNNRIRRVGPDGMITSVAGGHVGVCRTGDGGPATEAVLSYPWAVAVAPDGALYVADTDCQRIARVAPNGIITTVAGGRFDPSDGIGDGGPAADAYLNWPASIALGSDGSLFIAEKDGNRVRRVGTDGIITTVAGTGQGGFSGDGGLARHARLSEPASLAVAPDGALHIADQGNCRIRRVGPDGMITTVAGTGICEDSGDGVPALEAQLADPRAIAFAADGTLYIADDVKIRRVGTDGTISTLAGNGERPHYWGGFSGNGSAAAGVPLSRVHGVAVGPDGNVYLTDRDTHRIRRVTPSLPGARTGGFLIPAPDGSEVYVFSSGGRHLRTLDAVTGTVRYEFSYDGEGRLAAIEDGDQNRTTVERDDAGNPVAIVGPYGARTRITVDANGYLSSVSNPAEETFEFASTAGLLTMLTDPKGFAHRFTYDSAGRLIKDEDPAGGSKTLARTETENGYTVSVTTALGQTSTYAVDIPPSGVVRLLDTRPDGTTTETIRKKDGRRTVKYPDGTTLEIWEEGDPRWGMQAPILKTLIYRLPSGLIGTITGQRTVTLSDPTNPMTLDTQTDTLVINGRSFVSTYDASTRTSIFTTPAGRQTTTVLDVQGRVTQEQLGGLAAATYAYDSRGRLAAVTWGTGDDARTVDLTYDSSGYLDTIIDDTGGTVSFTYDSVGRAVSQAMPHGQSIAFAYDPNGTLIGLTPPGRPEHTFEYSPAALLSEYIPPALSPVTDKRLYAYNADRQTTKVTFPDAREVDFGYTEGNENRGRLMSVAFSRGANDYTYDPSTGTLTTISAPGGFVLGLDYDGILITGSSWSGSVAGTVSRTYDANLRVAARQVNSDGPLEFDYDDDSLLAQAGALTFTRDPQTGSITASSLHNVTTTTSYNGFGETAEVSAAFAGTEIFASRYVRGELGRIVQKTDTIDGIARTFEYEYDAAGRLVRVQQDGAAVETYTYDGNGNRLTGPNAALTYTYDDQDRLVSKSAGPATFTYTRNGEMASKTAGSQTTGYEYDEFGNLTGVALPGGTTIGYVIDGLNRRVGKTVNGSLVQGFLYEDALKPAVELDGNGAVVSRFVYAGRTNVPEYMVRQGSTYRIITDHLGSPRLIVDTVTGEIVQQIEYDAFGRIIEDTNPGFQPFGFAGGIYDPDTGLVRFGARDYDAMLGRWTAKDPILFAGGDTNLYGYVGNDPVNWIDPTGLKCFNFADNYSDRFRDANRWPVRTGLNLLGAGTVASATGGLTALKGIAELNRYRGEGELMFRMFTPTVLTKVLVTSTKTTILVGAAYEAGVTVGSLLGAAFDWAVESSAGAFQVFPDERTEAAYEAWATGKIENSPSYWAKRRNCECGY